MRCSRRTRCAGVAAELTQRVAQEGINLRGFAASVIGRQFVAYFGLDSLDDAQRALRILQTS